ncbi:ThuA domain-containing protein [Naasia sp. SYSU D00057]|uniref:ThuA domain-containing protein n=1 Tax=Naasia sp. SYSU D00057 TaxID=2817380 RepID=UPI001B30275A|nr:ThuA domain-containing protein [Naasia sp. SYSU D00057]
MPSSSAVPSALLLTGGRDPFVDPWHPFAETAPRIAAVLESAGLAVEVSDRVAERLADLSGVDLLVVSAPEPAALVPDGVRQAARRGLQAHLARGGAVAGVHIGAVGLLGLPEWRSAIGARWGEHTMHPPLGPADLDVVPGPATEGIESCSVIDERYTRLEMDPGAEVLISHRHDGREHPLLWRRERDGVRSVGDALGHDTRSFDSGEHVELLRRSFAWAAQAAGASAG